MARRSLDVVGHYARPDLFDLRVNARPQSVVQIAADGPLSRPQPRAAGPLRQPAHRRPPGGEAAARRVQRRGPRLHRASRASSSWPPPMRRASPTARTRAARPASCAWSAPDTLAFPSYDGNGMFKSLGNLSANPAVGLLFIDFEAAKRLRVNGRRCAAPRRSAAGRTIPGRRRSCGCARAHIFPNCPRYIHRMQMVEASPYVPTAGRDTPVPGWKRSDPFRDYLPEGRLTGAA